MNCSTALHSKLARGLLVFLLAACFSMASTKTLGLGLGTIHVDSMFGQPFAGSVEIIGPQGYDDQTIAVSLASRETHAQLGIDRALYADNLSFELIFEASGRAEIQIRGREPLSDPYLEFALEMRWPDGRIVRDYTVLVSMPSLSTPLLPAASPMAQNPSSESSIPHSSLYAIESGDTLSEIAERLEEREVSLTSAIQTLRAHNTDLLETRGNLGLRVGDRVRIPARDIFSQPAAPRAIAQNKTAANAQSGEASPGTNTDQARNLATPLAKAETRLRALGYANLQMAASGDTPNPVVASGAAAQILEQLIAEQAGGEPSYGSAQISRLAEGLNQVSDISRAYQERLLALEEATQANAEVLAALVRQNELGQEQPATVTAISSIASEAPVPATAPGPAPGSMPTQIASAPQTSSSATTSTSPVTASSTFKGVSSLLLWAPVLVALLGSAAFWVMRRQQSAVPTELPPARETYSTAEIEPHTVSEPQEKTENETANETAEAENTQSQEQAEDSEEEPAATSTTPFYDEVYEDEESSVSEEPEQDLTSELDEELKLISIFEENLASEAAVRTQIKQEESLISEAMPATEEEDILDFGLDSLEPEENLEFILDESEPESEFEEEQPGLDDLLEWKADEASAEDEETPADNEQASTENVAPTAESEEVEQEAQASSKTDPSSENSASNYAGYAETSGFSQINSVEVIDIVERKLKAAKSSGQESTLFYVEIDQFDQLEKELGILKAEKLAANIASSIFEQIENPITLRRFRQDGFVLVLAGGQNQQNLQFGEELASAIASTPMEVSNETFFVTLSIGIVPVASGFSNSAEIIEMARQVVGDVREQQNGSGAMLCELDPDTAFNEASIMRSGRKLLSEHSLVTVYQPITALKGDPLEFYEARLKITEGCESNSFPEDLLERLANTDLSTEIDCLNVSQALGELNDYLNSHISTRLFITISARTATDNFFKNWFEKTLFSEGIHPERVVFQMPEPSAGRHLNSLIGFRDYAHALGARICISQLDFQHIPEHALARLHPDFVQLHPGLASDAQQESEDEQDLEKQRRGLTRLTEALEKARPLCEKIIVPGVSQARIIPTLWPLSVDYIQGDYIQPESLVMDFEFDQVAH